MFSEKMLSNVVSKKFAFPVFIFRKFEPMYWAKIQQQYNLSTLYVYKREKEYIVYSLDKVHKKRLAKIIKKNMVYHQWIKYANIYYSLSNKIYADKVIECLKVCELPRESIYPKVKQLRKPRVRVVM